MTAATAGPAVVVPAGVPLVEAATWAGQACWAELRLHEVLTGWLADEPDAARRLAWWSIRAHRALVAERWHHRLPELRELPRASFVAPSGDGATAWFDSLAATDLAGPARPAALAATLHALTLGYEARRSVAVGPADGPVADTLALAIARAVADDAAVLGLAEADTAPLTAPPLP